MNEENAHGLWQLTKQDDLGIVVDSAGERIASTYYSAAKQLVEAHNAAINQLAASRAMLPVTDSQLLDMAARNFTAGDYIFDGNEVVAYARRVLALASPVAGWVSVEDERKPAEHEVVAVIGPAYGSFDKGRYVSSATYYNGEFFTEDGDQMHPPSHWQHLPPAPVTPRQEQS